MPLDTSKIDFSNTAMPQDFIRFGGPYMVATGKTGYRGFAMYGDQFAIWRRGTADDPNSDTLHLRLDKNGHLLPGSSGSQDLGSESYKWRDAYIGRNLYVDGFVKNLNRVTFYDDFIGNDLLPWWYPSAYASLLDMVGGVVRLETPSASGGSAELDSFRKNFSPSDAVMEWRARISHTTYVTVFIQYGGGGTAGYARVIYEGGGSAGTWKLQTYDGTTLNEVDTGVTVDTNWHTFRLEVTASEVRLYIDGALKATSTANLPTGPAKVWFYIRTEEDVAKYLDVDYVWVSSARS